MKKTIKWLLIVVGALVALVIVALVVIPMFVDVQEYKPEIEKKVSEMTGRTFTINGDLKLSLFHGWVWPSQIFISGIHPASRRKISLVLNRLRQR